MMAPMPEEDIPPIRLGLSAAMLHAIVSAGEPRTQFSSVPDEDRRMMITERVELATAYADALMKLHGVRSA